MKQMTLISIVATIAASVPAMQSPTWSNPKSDPNQIICKNQPRAGTRFMNKICHTRAEWDQIAEANKRVATEMANRPPVQERHYAR